MGLPILHVLPLSLIASLLFINACQTQANLPTTQPTPQTPETTTPEDSEGVSRERGYWNQQLTLVYATPQTSSSMPKVYVNNRLLPDEAVLDFTAEGVTIRFDPPKNKRLKDKARLYVELDGARVALARKNGAQTFQDFEMHGAVASQQLNVLLPCQPDIYAFIRKFEAFEVPDHFRDFDDRPFKSEDYHRPNWREDKDKGGFPFKVIDYYGDQIDKVHPDLGANQHRFPWCLLVVAYEQLPTHYASDYLTYFLTRALDIPVLATSPNYYIYSGDPSVHSFDTECSEVGTLQQEAQGANVLAATELRPMLGASGTGEGVTVALFDSGVLSPSTYLNSSGPSRFSRSFLTADYPQPSQDYQVIQDDYDCSDTPFVDGHGSLVEAIVRQIAPDTDLISFKVCSAEGLCKSSAIIKALLTLRNRPAGLPDVDIVNMSFGGDISDNQVFETLLKSMLNERDDILLVASVGNSSSDSTHYPAEYQLTFPNVLAVAAAKQLTGSTQWQLATFNTQATTEAIQRSSTLLAAPGVRLVIDGLGDPAGVTGTSFAAPIVTGVAALIEAQQRPADLPTALISHAKALGGFKLIQAP